MIYEEHDAVNRTEDPRKHNDHLWPARHWPVLTQLIWSPDSPLTSLTDKWTLTVLYLCADKHGRCDWLRAELAIPLAASIKTTDKRLAKLKQAGLLWRIDRTWYLDWRPICGEEHPEINHRVLYSGVDLRWPKTKSNPWWKLCRRILLAKGCNARERAVLFNIFMAEGVPELTQFERDNWSWRKKRGARTCCTNATTLAANMSLSRRQLTGYLCDLEGRDLITQRQVATEKGHTIWRRSLEWHSIQGDFPNMKKALQERQLVLQKINEMSGTEEEGTDPLHDGSPGMPTRRQPPKNKNTQLPKTLTKRRHHGRKPPTST